MLIKKELDIYKSIAKEGSGNAQKSLGYLYEQGEGTEKSDTLKIENDDEIINLDETN